MVERVPDWVPTIPTPFTDLSNLIQEMEMADSRREARAIVADWERRGLVKCSGRFPHVFVWKRAQPEKPKYHPVFRRRTVAMSMSDRTPPVGGVEVWEVVPNLDDEMAHVLGTGQGREKS